MLLHEISGVYRPAIETLEEMGISTLEQVSKLTYEDLIAIKNVGTSTANLLLRLAKDNVSEEESLVFDASQNDIKYLCGMLTCNDLHKKIEVRTLNDVFVFQLDSGFVYTSVSESGGKAALVFNKDFCDCRLYLQ